MTAAARVGGVWWDPLGHLGALPQIPFLAKPQRCNDTCGAAAGFFIQIGLNAITYPESFPDESSKVTFAIFFMTYYVATWFQPYLTKVFNKEAVVFSHFMNNFKSSFFNHNHQKHAEIALQNLFPTRTVLATLRTSTCTPPMLDGPKPCS
ncbi:uncharacterized protein VP01_1004g12 [Puccinia sorghi]|uniref:Uncharacterized protein n=1 Tax=Puccinia sorghi TaxID=27349 RepID=A0A0L6VVL5_9BASI|nr:uncharacterized protein VP01_1004g12 [Puccinia sorghi]